MRTIYLDHAAATYVEPTVLEKMLPYFAAVYGNPSSLHAQGRSAKSALDSARRSVACLFDAGTGKVQLDEIIFTGSGTESDNLALFGIAESYSHLGKHIIVSKIEHKAVLEAAKRLEKRGFEVTYLAVDAFGMINPEDVRRAIRPDTILVSIMYANNEIGTIQPIGKIAEVIAKTRQNPENDFRNEANEAPPFFHTDACQAAGVLSLNVRELGVDLLTLNGSKIYGPKGVGCLYKRRSVRLMLQTVGGEQEHRLRAGSENVAAIVGFAHALEIADSARQEESRRLAKLRDYAIGCILQMIPQARLNGHPTDRLPNNINISIFGIEGEAILLMLDRYGICASTGSACAALDLVPSHVLLAIGLSPEYAHGSIRFTMGRKTTKRDVEYVLRVLPKIVSNLRAISSAWPMKSVGTNVPARQSL